MAGLADNRIVVDGVAERSVAPDTAVWSVGIREQRDDEREAFDACATRSQSVATALHELGDDIEIATSAVTLQERYGHEEESPSQAATCSLTAICPVERTAEVGEAAVHAGATSLSGPRFVVASRSQIEEELLAVAVDLARRKARVIATAAERRLGNAVSVREHGVSWEDAEEDEGVYVRSVQALSARSGGMPTADVVEQRVTVGVTVLWELPTTDAK